MSNYTSISNFGVGAINTSSNPLNYCLLSGMNSAFNNGFMGDSLCGANSKNCQAFMSDYCANNWNDICEIESTNQSKVFPNNIQGCGIRPGLCPRMSAGDILIANTAAKKYLSKAGGCCYLNYEPFDPTVASSPLISFVSGKCIPVYEVDPKTIDNDPVMNKLLNKPIIAWNLLVNIYNTAKRKNTLDSLKNTRLYRLFQSNEFQGYMKAKQNICPGGVVGTKSAVDGSKNTKDSYNNLRMLGNQPCCTRQMC